MTQQLDERRFMGMDYEYNLKPGEFIATIDGQVWRKGKKLFTHMTFADGRKIVTRSCPRSKTEGLAGVEEGNKVRVFYKADRTGVLCVRRVTLLAEKVSGGVPAERRN